MWRGAASPPSLLGGGPHPSSRAHPHQDALPIRLHFRALLLHLPLLMDELPLNAGELPPAGRGEGGEGRGGENGSARIHQMEEQNKGTRAALNFERAFRGAETHSEGEKGGQNSCPRGREEREGG